ncbi:MAG: transglutaminase family protein [Cyanobacteria bacterium J06623_7]
MFYQISHQTIYSFSQPVILKPHLLRLCPRSDRFNQLQSFTLSVLPSCQGTAEMVDLNGNNVIKLWFNQPTQQLSIQTTSEIATTCTNPFNYLLEPWALTIPFDYPSSLKQQLEGYLSSYSFVRDNSILELAQAIAIATQNNTLDFLFALNQRIYQECTYCQRDLGEPLPAGVTWRDRRGSCRDYAVLFMEICRTMGIAARFVSGYQEGDAAQQGHDLHAWVEVYLPGAGWRGYDPTLGLIVSDRHIPVAASAIPKYAAPIAGTITPVTMGAKIVSELRSQISLITPES